MPVIAPFELDDLVAPRRRSRDANRTHRRFSSRADEADAFQRGHELTDAFAEVDFERTRRAVAGAGFGRGGHRLDEPARRVPVNQRPPRHHVIDERVAVDVFEARAVGPFDEQRRARRPI